MIPVRNANSNNWDRRSYWKFPWGESDIHYGIDIFADRGTDVVAPTYGIVTSVQSTVNGGNVISFLGPKWHTHYFAHLDTVLVKPFQIVQRGNLLGRVGNTGNAKGKPPHLHYSIHAWLPYLWNYDEFAPHGHLKMFYLNPESYFE